MNQLDLRFTKDLRFGRRGLRANFDIYNALNGNYVRTVNANYASWLVPTGFSIRGSSRSARSSTSDIETGRQLIGGEMATQEVRCGS